MDFGNAIAAIGIDFNLFSKIIRFMSDNNQLPESVQLADSQGFLTGLGYRMEFRIVDGNPRALLLISGTYMPPDNPSQAFVFSYDLRAAKGVDERDEEPYAYFLAAAALDMDTDLGATLLIIKLFSASTINDVLRNIKLPIIGPLIDAFESTLFSQSETLPRRSDWPIRSFWATESRVPRKIFRTEPVGGNIKGSWNIVLESDNELPTVPALVILLYLPRETNMEMADISSFTPNRTGLMVCLTKKGMNLLLSKKASEQIGKKDDEGVKTTALSMEMVSEGIRVSGKAEKLHNSIEWNGTIVARFFKYYRVNNSLRNSGGDLWMDSQNMNVEFHRAWYYYLAIPLLLVPGLNVVIDNFILSPVDAGANAAPGQVKGTLTEQLSRAFDALSSAAEGLNIGSFPTCIFSNDAWIAEGNILYSYYLFAGSNGDIIAGVEKDKFNLGWRRIRGTSAAMYNLASGYRLHPTELGQLLKKNVLKITGYHGVEAEYGYYVRSNPNRTVVDNIINPAEIERVRE